MRAATTDGAAAAGPAVELVDVTRRFVTPDAKVMTALRDFTMTVERGEFVCVVGPTGCGKSTTLNLVTGLARPDRGEVRVFGQPVGGISRDIGFVFQADALFPWRSVLDNVAARPRMPRARHAPAGCGAPPLFYDFGTVPVSTS